MVPKSIGTKIGDLERRNGRYWLFCIILPNSALSVVSVAGLGVAACDRNQQINRTVPLTSVPCHNLCVCD